MARQRGIIKLKGKVGDLSFYKTQDGHLAREKGGVDRARIANDPAFIRTRENGAEFGSSAKAGKVLRDALRPLMMVASDGRVTSRMTKLMTDIKNFDTVNARGERLVSIGIADVSAKSLVKGFNFNIRSNLGSVLFRAYAVDVSTGEIVINGLVPVNDFNFPSGATHISLRGAWAKIDFLAGTSDVQISPSSNLFIDGTTSNIVLTPPTPPAGAGVDIFLLCVEFFQEVNGIQYSLKNGAFNALTIVEIV